MSTQIKKIGVIIASTRPKRIGPGVVDFIISLLEPHLNGEFSLSPISIADFKLPVYDEVALPQMITNAADYTHQHTRDWSAAVAPFDGFIIVTPTYNGGTPAALKNALDFLYNEWTGKPVYIIGYGIDGGKRASASLSVSLIDAFKMKVVETKPELVFPGIVGPAMYAAAGGVLVDECLVEWTKQSSEILRGFDILKDLLIKP